MQHPGRCLARRGRLLGDIVRARSIHILLALALLVGLGTPVTAARAPQGVGLHRAFTITVKDHDGTVEPGARITIRDGETYDLLYQVYTDAYGQATVDLTDWAWYVVTVVATDYGVEEFWYYNYILPADWNDGSGKVMQRKDPWLDIVSLPPAPVPAGDEQDFVVTIDHNHEATNYGLKIWVLVWVDDDGEEPYLYAGVSAMQTFFGGLQPFHLSYTPPAPGDYLVRFRIDRQWEEGQRYVADEGGWTWQLQVVESGPTPTPEPCRVAGRVYEDLDRDGSFGGLDAPVAGAEVLLCDAWGVVVYRQFSDDIGQYVFDDLAPGSYIVGLGTVPGVFQRRDGPFELDCRAGQQYSGVDFRLLAWYVRLPCIMRD